MHLSQLRIRDFRCLAACDLTPSPGMNLVIGDNASGKSSLLEAIYFLGRARSFRGTHPARLVRSGQPSFSLTAKAKREQRRSQRIGIQRDARQTRIKIDNNRDTALLDLVAALPIQIIDPNLHSLIEQGPGERRRYLDWGVFHVEHAFFPAWRRYRRALRQRNGALRAGLSKSNVVAWDGELVHAALEVDACRRSYLTALETIVPELVKDVLGEGQLILDYYPGWNPDLDYGAALAKGLGGDARSGFTHAGPHRADLRVRMDTLQVRDWVSRGQQKVITAVMLLAQAALLDHRRQIKPVLLIDDLAAELGADYRAALFRIIERIGCQCFLTFLDADLVPEGAGEATMFHVEHGQVRAR